MRRSAFYLGIAILFAGPPGPGLIPAVGIAQEHRIAAQPASDPGAAQFDKMLKESLATLAKAGGYSVDVESQWGAAGDPHGPQGASHYRLVAQGAKYRVEVQSQAANAPELVCVNDGAEVTTWYPARKLYARHPAASPDASLAANTMLALSLQGSALDLLLQHDVAAAVHAQASGIKDHGDEILAGQKARRFELNWAAGQVQLWFAAEGDKLPLQYTRKSVVPTADNRQFEMISTAKFRWQPRVRPADSNFALAIPADARRVSEIYSALCGEESHTLVGQPLPKLRLARLDGADVELAAAPDKKATVLIFWATWCAASIQDMPAIHKFVAEYQQRDVVFYAVNVGEQPGEVRRFTAKTPLVSMVLLDPHSKASSALRLTELPAVAIIGPDNTIRATLHGKAQNLQTDLAAQLEQLLTAPTKTASRPGQPATPKN
jgi:thiol-disulfide isomerase/thioredoxin